MRYNTKQLFQNAAQVVASEFGNLYSEGQEVPKKPNEGNVEIALPRSKKTKDKSVKEILKEAYLETQAGDYMKAYRDTLTTLENAQRNRPRFANAKIYMGQSKPGMARGSSFGAISEADPEKLIKENRTRMKDFVISKAYLKA
tara:strand:- start:1046 stop:1474 length:429 start_codon:yes stop_codon:yes gene_type:complete